MLLQGLFISYKLTFLEISDMPILEKMCISLYLGYFGSQFQLTPTAAATATARRQFFHLARALAHSGQGWNIPFGNPSLRCFQMPLDASQMSSRLWLSCCNRLHPFSELLGGCRSGSKQLIFCFFAHRGARPPDPHPGSQGPYIADIPNITRTVWAL